MTAITLTSKGQATIPKQIRDLLGPGSRAGDVLYSTRILKKTGLRLA